MMTPLKAVSLWQPWASAIPVGLKGFETRHWQTVHRGDIAIHAAKCWNAEQRQFLDDLGETYAEGLCQDWGKLPFDLPKGEIVAVAELVDIESTEALRDKISQTERRWGNYESFTMVRGVPKRRYGWRLTNVRPLKAPVFTVGRQSIWTLPDDIAAQVRANIDQVPA